VLLDAGSIPAASTRTPVSSIKPYEQPANSLGFRGFFVACRLGRPCAVGSVVAKGDYQLGFQQVSELLPVPGIEFVGKIPESLQSVTRYAAGIPVSAAHPREARQFLDFLASPEAASDVASTGLDPLAAH
jgi:hypothetical protein